MESEILFSLSKFLLSKKRKFLSSLYDDDDDDGLRMGFQYPVTKVLLSKLLYTYFIFLLYMYKYFIQK